MIFARIIETRKQYSTGDLALLAQLNEKYRSTRRFKNKRYFYEQYFAHQYMKAFLNLKIKAKGIKRRLK